MKSRLIVSGTGAEPGSKPPLGLAQSAPSNETVWSDFEHERLPQGVFVETSVPDEQMEEIKQEILACIRTDNGNGVLAHVNEIMTASAINELDGARATYQRIRESNGEPEVLVPFGETVANSVPLEKMA